ncbi:hypothetical protein GCM10017717_30200 [Deinococcus persicinus]
MRDYELYELGDIQLQSGDILPNAVLAYQTSMQKRIMSLFIPHGLQACIPIMNG